MAIRSENFLLRRYIEKAMVDLPAMPTTVLRVVKSIEEGDASASQIERIITGDAAITSKVLKTVNSPYFGMARQVTSITQAITILGMNQLRNVTLSIGVLNALSSTSPRIQAIQKSAWESSFASASCATRIAKAKGLSNTVVETALVGGLLHDIGQLFLLTLFNIPYTEVITRSRRLALPLHHVERQVLGTTHAELGASLGERWSFPADLVSMIRLHDGEIGAEDLTPSVACVHLADRIVNRIVNPDEPDIDARYPFDPNIVGWSGLTEEQFNEITEEVKGDIEKAKAVNVAD
ncbi:MAG: HDOD domain-containing protein [Fimbriimonadaceae bacterium]|nr:HDOD domain-containing protein [Fimbriimonadaceae bacterium]